MEKGLKNLQGAARTRERRAPTESSVDAVDTTMDYQGITDRNSDSGIGFGSDAEMDVDGANHSRRTSSSWHAASTSQNLQHQEHIRSRSLPQLLPLYQPPPPLNTQYKRVFDRPVTTSPATTSYPGRPAEFQRYSPDFQNGRGGLSIQSMLSPADPLR